MYLRMDRVPAVLKQWREQGADYVGCMKTGGRSLGSPSLSPSLPFNSQNLPFDSLFPFLLFGHVVLPCTLGTK